MWANQGVAGNTFKHQMFKHVHMFKRIPRDCRPNSVRSCAHWIRLNMFAANPTSYVWPCQKSTERDMITIVMMIISITASPSSSNHHYHGDPLEPLLQSLWSSGANLPVYRLPATSLHPSTSYACHTGSTNEDKWKLINHLTYLFRGGDGFDPLWREVERVVHSIPYED